MRNVILDLVSLIGSSFFVQFSNAAITTMIAIIVAAEGGDQSDVALIASAFSAGFIIGCFLSPPQLYRIGLIRGYAAAAGILTIAVVALELNNSIIGWTILRFLMGASFATVMAISDTWINSRTPGDQRGSVIAVYSTVLGLASIVSQLCFFFLDAGEEGFILLFAISMNLAVVLVALGASVPPVQSHNRPNYIRPLTLVSTPATVSAFTAGFSTTSLVSIIPFHLSENGASENLVAIVVATLYLGRLVSQWPIGKLSDRVDRRKVLTGLSLVVLGVAVPSMIFSGSDGLLVQGDEGLILQILALIMCLVIGGTLWPMYSVASALAFDRADGKPMIDISTTLLVVNSFGAILGPLTVLFTANIVGDYAFLICISTLCALNAVMCTSGLLIRKAPENPVSSLNLVPDNSLEMAQATAEMVEDQLKDPSESVATSS
jgi:MFS family permease